MSCVTYRQAKQVLDFARFIQTQDKLSDNTAFEIETLSEELLADEARWDELFSSPESERLMAKMVEGVRADIRAGRTTPMLIKHEEYDRLLKSQ